MPTRLKGPEGHGIFKEVCGGGAKKQMANVIHFENPPVEEVVCGIHFTGVEWTDIHFGLFFAELNGRYQKTHRRPPLTLFRPRSQEHSEITLVAVNSLEPPLMWYESHESPFLLQIQNDAFFLNWRGQSSAFAYPHFRTREGGEEGVWDRFLREWDVFQDFCKKLSLGTPEVLDCHLAYVDHLSHGEVWNNPIDLVGWIKPLDGLKNFEALLSLNLTFQYESGSLPVRVNIRPGVRRSDKKNLYIVDFVITQKLPSESSLELWFDEAHSAIVQEFLRQTTKYAQTKWGLSNG